MNDAGEVRKSSRSSKTSRRFKYFPLLSRKNSPPYSNFNPSDILPQEEHRPHPSRTISNLDSRQIDGSQPVFGALAGGPRSGDGSVSPPSVFDQADGQHEQDTDPTTTQGSDDPSSYDLKPPAPSVSHSNIEALATRFFSADHLDLILRDQVLATRFTQFLAQYRPQHSAALKQYIESKKAITAIEYANAIAGQIPTTPGEPRYVAATLDEAFEEKSRQTADDLVEEALPGYLTHRLVSMVTESLVKEITGTNMPLMRDLIPSLAEVYCISDPSLPDNPLVYASEGK